MILSKEQVLSVVHGAEHSEYDGEWFRFYRFNQAQMDLYRETIYSFYEKSKATSGVNFDFYTDSSAFSFDYTVVNGSSRNFYFFDVYVDGVLTLHRGEQPMWIMNGTLSVKLPAGEHRVTVWFPNLASASVRNVTVDDDATVRPAEKKLRMICWGDSISQGYDAIFPSLAYTNRLAQHFDAYMINQAIGGEIFRPALLDCGLDFRPDIITVAYGTNDWSKCSNKDFCDGVDGFLGKLAEQYSYAKVFILTPIWRGDRARVTQTGTFDFAVKYIADKAHELGLNVIEGYNLVPHWSEFYSDLRLHPNDLGYGEYSRNLIAAMEAML